MFHRFHQRITLPALALTVLPLSMTSAQITEADVFIRSRSRDQLVTSAAVRQLFRNGETPPVILPVGCRRSDDSAWRRRRPQSEPFGAEDKGAEDNIPSIPEPMVFDLVRGLGAHRGEFEINVLGEFPLSTGGGPAPPGFDPFGLAPSSEDQDGIEWAPEVEYAVCDGFALEFELPYENSTLEAYKFAAQLTFGTALDNRFIDGMQVIVEPDINREVWDLTFLYLAGMQFDETWSVLGMIGARPEIEEGIGLQHTDGIFNLTVFADVDHSTTVALESNLTFGESERTSLLLIPQIDREITDNIEIQIGAGVGFSEEGTEPLAAARLIYSR